MNLIHLVNLMPLLEKFFYTIVAKSISKFLARAEEPTQCTYTLPGSEKISRRGIGCFVGEVG